jgi:hypothetical protein
LLAAPASSGSSKLPPDRRNRFLMITHESHQRLESSGQQPVIVVKKEDHRSTDNL